MTKTTYLRKSDRSLATIARSTVVRANTNCRKWMPAIRTSKRKKKRGEQNTVSYEAEGSMHVRLAVMVTSIVKREF